MAFIEWTEAMSVGVPALDADHKILVSLINQLKSVVGDDEEYATLGSVLNTLVDYTAHHFLREERVMEACGYPRLAEHMRQHEALTSRVIDAQCRYIEDREDVVGDDLLTFLKDWLTSHILEEDMAYRRYVEGDEAADKAAATVEAIGRPLADEPDAPFDWGTLKVLIVDENQALRTVTRTIMEVVRVAEVRESSSAAGAMEQMRKYLPGAVVCGGRVGGMDGIEFARRVRDDSSPAAGIPIVMMIGPSEADYVERAEAAGVDRCLQKPIRALTLLETLAEVVGGKA